MVMRSVEGRNCELDGYFYVESWSCVAWDGFLFVFGCLCKKVEVFIRASGFSGFWGWRILSYVLGCRYLFMYNGE